MKTENIPADIKSKSLKEAKNEINEILERLENSKTDLKASEKEYNRLIKLNKHVGELFKKKMRGLSSNFKRNGKKKT